MKIKNTSIIFGIVAVLIGVGAGALYLFYSPMSPNASSISGQAVFGAVSANLVGKQAPDFNLTTIDGSHITLADLQATGKPTVFYFWATWCPFCKDELTHLKSVYPFYENRVNFIGVDVDVDEDASTIRSTVSANGFLGNFTVANVPMLESYGVYDTATKIVVASNGTIIAAGSGESTDQYWTNVFNQAISA